VTEATMLANTAVVQVHMADTLYDFIERARDVLGMSVARSALLGPSINAQVVCGPLLLSEFLRVLIIPKGSLNGATNPKNGR
jgi:hypothetical protein